MKSFSVWFKTHKTFSLAVLFLVLYSMTLAFAIPNKYTPGETLDPGCAPGDTNCTVDIGGGGSPDDILRGSGLVVRGTASSSTIGDVQNVQPAITYDPGNTLGYNRYADGTTNEYQVYAYKTVGGQRVYSATPGTASVTDDNSNNFYKVTVSWSPVTGADGYKILVQNYNAYETTGTTFEDDQNTCGGTCNYSDNIVVPSSLNDYSGGDASIGGSVTVGSYDPSSNLQTAGDGKVLATGGMKFNSDNSQGTSNPSAVSTTAMLWYPARSAFIAGTIDGSTGYDEDDIGSFSTAFGQNAVASGDHSMAFGEHSLASGEYATSFGLYSVASGDFATAFGYFNTASGAQATAFGDTNLASGIHSTVFGINNTASGDSSTAFGQLSTASEANATAFGFNNHADGIGSTSFGGLNFATNSFATSFGFNTTASNNLATSFGYSTTASGENSTSFGSYTHATARQSVAFGYQGQSTADNALAFGNSSTASGQSSTAFGNNTQATGAASVSFGNYGSVASGEGALAFGYQSIASGSSSVAFGVYGSQAQNSGDVAYGYFSIASGGLSTAFGYQTTASAQSSTAFGTSAQDIDAGMLVNTLASGLNSTAFGAGTLASGDTSTAFGTLTQALGVQATAFGYKTNAQGDNALAIGYGTTASERQSTALGDHTTASGFNSTAMGYYTVANGDNSLAFGDHAVTVGGNSNSLAFGGYNVGLFDSVLEIGVGGINSSDLRNAVTVKKNTDFGIGTSSFTSLFQVAQQVQGYGTVSITAGTSNVTGNNTEFTNTFKIGDAITIDDGNGPETHNVLTITNDNFMTVDGNWVADGTYAYTIVGGNRFTVKGNGFVGIGINTPGYLLDVGSSSVITGTPVAHFANGGGTCTITPSVTGGITCSSDKNLKQNIKQLVDGDTAWDFNSNVSFDNHSVLSKVLALTPVSYNWNVEKITDPKHAGFIAQEVEQVFPDLVATDPETHLQSLNYAGFMPYTIQAIKEMDLNITKLSDLNRSNTWRDGLIAWFGTANNGITSLFSKKITTDQLCVGTVCVTQQQFMQMVQNGGGGSTSSISQPVVEKTPDPVDPPAEKIEEVVTDPAVQ